MKISLLLASLLVFLLACGGSGSDAPSLAQSPPSVPVTQNTNCDSNHILSSTVYGSVGEIIENYSPDKLIDYQMGAASAWISSSQSASVDLKLESLSAIKQIKIAWHNGNKTRIDYQLATSIDGVQFDLLGDVFQSSGKTRQFETQAIPSTQAQYLRLITNLQQGEQQGVTEILIYGCALDGSLPATINNFDSSNLALNPLLPPGENFDLLSWSLNTPADLDGDGKSDKTSETALAAGFEDEYFFTASDGGMVLRSTLYGAKTSNNTKYTRTELREMLRRGDTSISTRGVGRNNWLLGYQPETSTPVGGRNGQLAVTMAVNQVSTSGEDYQVGRVIIGQIHAEDDEPIRLYYRKLPNHQRGILYFAHELRGGEDIYRMLLGPTIDNEFSQPELTTDPELGIKLNEVFSYQIIQDGSRIDVLVRRGDADARIIAHQYVDMEELASGYDVTGEWVYFKVGAYSQNNSGDASEFDQVTIYQLRNSHP